MRVLTRLGCRVTGLDHHGGARYLAGIAFGGTNSVLVLRRGEDG